LDTIEQVVPPAGGVVTHPDGAVVEVDSGTFPTAMTVAVAHLPDTMLPASRDVELVSASGFTVTITGEDGVAVTDLPEGVVLQLPVPAGQREDSRIYRIEDNRLVSLSDSGPSDLGVTAPLPHLSRFVAGIPHEEAPELGWLPWIVAIAAAISGVIIIGLLALSAVRRRRPARIRRV
jgi:hypothetical protein